MMEATKTRPARAGGARAKTRQDDARPAQGVVGPNTVVQLAAELRAQGGDAIAGAVFQAAGASEHLTEPPEAMIDERVPARLFHAVYALLDTADADAVMRGAGRRTGDYIIAHRIPDMAKRILATLPAAAGAALLLRAIQANAWTFAGSGQCAIRCGAPAILEIRGNPLATPGCVWHRAVFARLFGVLLNRPAPPVRHPTCAYGRPDRDDATCRFEIDWSRK